MTTFERLERVCIKLQIAMLSAAIYGKRHASAIAGTAIVTAIVTAIICH